MPNRVLLSNAVTRGGQHDKSPCGATTQHCSVGRRPEAPGPGPRVPLTLARGPALGGSRSISRSKWTCPPVLVTPSSLCQKPKRSSSSGIRKATAHDPCRTGVGSSSLCVAPRRAALARCAAVTVGATTGGREAGMCMGERGAGTAAHGSC